MMILSHYNWVLWSVISAKNGLSFFHVDYAKQRFAVMSHMINNLNNIVQNLTAIISNNWSISNQILLNHESNGNRKFPQTTLHSLCHVRLAVHPFFKQNHHVYQMHCQHPGHHTGSHQGGHIELLQILQTLPQAALGPMPQGKQRVARYLSQKNQGTPKNENRRCSIHIHWSLYKKNQSQNYRLKGFWCSHLHTAHFYCRFPWALLTVRRLQVWVHSPYMDSLGLNQIENWTQKDFSFFGIGFAQTQCKRQGAESWGARRRTWLFF